MKKVWCTNPSRASNSNASVRTPRFARDPVPFKPVTGGKSSLHTAKCMKKEDDENVHRQMLNSVLALVSASLVTQSAIGADIEPVYFGNGCFWGRQYDFAMTEERVLGRAPGEVSAVVGYAGGKVQSPSGKVCYYYTTDRDSVYEHLGHAEVVEVELRGSSGEDQAAQFRKFADTYFAQFRKMPGGQGMMRQDPQDAGPGYRNVVGIPGGINSPLFQILKEANTNGMVLKEGKGNEYVNGQASEGDLLNTVWVIDSSQLGFHKAEMYHQFHNGLGKEFPPSYRRDLKAAAMAAGRIQETGCPEYYFLAS